MELLVALVVLCLLCLALFSILSNSSALWQNQEGKEEGIREARAALSFFSRDFRNAIASGRNDWFYVDSNRVAFMASLPASAQDTNVSKSDICAIGYSLEWGKVTQGNPMEKERMALYRYVKFSDAAHRSINLQSNSVETVFGDVDHTNSVRELLAKNVSKLSIEPYVTNSSGQLIPYVASTNLPDVVRFSITTLNERTASRLIDQASWTDGTSPDVLQNQQTFTLMVRPGK